MDAFEALSGLSKLGKKTKEVEIDKLKLLLSTINSEDETDVFVSCSELTGNGYFYKMKSETLKYAIKAVNGQRLDEYEKIEDEEKRVVMRKETLEKLQNVIGTWDENLVSFIYSKWTELTKEAEKDLKDKGLMLG